MPRAPLRFTPFHAAGVLLLFVGLGLGVYHGHEQARLVPRVAPLTSSWVSWSHIHFVTVGGMTQLILGMLPQLAARRLGRPRPSRWYTWLNFLALNAGFLLVWYGRGWGHVWAFDAGLVVVWLLVAGLVVVLVGMARRSDRRLDATGWLYLLSPFVFLWGLIYAWGLFAHLWTVPGGWLGLREAHVHANAWGFLAFAVIGTLYAVYPRLAGADLYSVRLKRASVPLFAAGIFPLITGPWLGLGRSVTVAGLVLYAAGFGLYLYTLARTYLAGSRSALARWLLIAQFWILGPAGFAPFVLFGVEWVRPAFIEDGALHFFFVGWALPVVLAGLLLSARNLPATGDLVGRGADAVPGIVSGWMVWAWNLAVLVVGVGFFYQDQAWSVAAFALGWPVIAGLWAYLLAQAVRLRRTAGPGPGWLPAGVADGD